jgi:protein-S-isoprenylcysteine O-methyltransferase Ste14
MTTGTIGTNSSTVTRGVVRWFIRETMGTLMASVILFLCADRWDWLWGWVTVATIIYYVGGTAFVLLPKNPALLAERTGPKKGAKKWDTLIMSAVGTLILVIYIVGGLDVRYGWTSNFPTWAQIIGVVLTMMGYTLVLWAIAANAFFSLIVRVQTERGHTVATDGPYGFVRHPGYVGTILAYVGTPMLLGSLWTIVLGVVAAILMIVRTALEDKTLLTELDRYKEYAARVRYRLLPGVW